MTEEIPLAQNTASRDGAQHIVLVTGPSGAGRSTAIHVLEDLGYEPIDNLPLSLIPRLLDGPPMDRPVALGIDVRNRDFSANALIALIDALTRDPQVQAEVLYLDCAVGELVRRYGETRRRHPLRPDAPPEQGALAETDLLAPIRARADVLIDTSELSPHDLRAELARWFDRTAGNRMAIALQSFSYKRGVPRGLDMMFDCRFLRNPHWDARLRPLDGRDRRVADFVAADPRFDPFLERLRDLLAFVIPAHVQEGKTHLTIGIGCTGGQHRSVAVVENMANLLAEAGLQVSIRHRELERRSVGPADSGV